MSTAPQRRRSRMAKIESRQALGFVTPALVGLCLFTIVPVCLSIVMSLYNWPAFGERSFIAFNNYKRLLIENPDFLPAVRNSVIFTVLYVPANIIVSLALAFIVGPRIRGRNAFRVLFFIPVVTPMVANVLVWKMLLQPQGLFNGIAKTWFGFELPSFLAHPQWAMVMIVVMSVWQGAGYNMLIFSAAIEQLPEQVIEAARIDGAHGKVMLFKVILPMMSPAIFFASVMTVISSLQVFVQPQMLTGGGPGNSTMPIVMFIYTTGFKFQQLGMAAAAAWILFFLVILVTAFQFKAQKRWVHYEV
ncbi:carbohydrate ABC transporter permease [Schaalia sp. lx-260]|uniref:carbohydrate ABC transporter permease n=1 Tax=Schaalia sp. lx-260 TaxID=2899082 RepID=UPI001E2A996C|nr:sugar ABC transporter permease [Schaalia sp. lx-260]MCD4550161.1 sugar ABC transporter permease [Schaalia sp. lx-260]